MEAQAETEHDDSTESVQAQFGSIHVRHIILILNAGILGTPLVVAR